MPMTLFNLGPSGICLLAAAFLLIWYLVSAATSYFRLRHIPAPSLLATFSYLWIARITYSGKQYWIHRGLNDKYGSLVRIGPNQVLTDDSELVRRINSINSSYKKSRFYITGRFDPYHDTVFTIFDPEPHKRARARSAAAYSGRETPGLEVIIDEHIRTLIDIVRQRYMATSTTRERPLLDLGSISCYFTMDVITHLAFGQQKGYLRDETDHFDFLGGVRRLWPQMSTCADVPWIREVLFAP